MQPANASQTSWLKTLVVAGVKDGNGLVVTQSPNISAAFPDHAQGLAEGEALVLKADGKGGANLVARIKIEEWAGLTK
jgi:hypothetical protein